MIDMIVPSFFLQCHFLLLKKNTILYLKHYKTALSGGLYIMSLLRIFTKAISTMKQDMIFPVQVLLSF